MSTTLQDLVNRAVFYSTEMQTHFGTLIADAEWEVDFTADPHLTFRAEDQVVLSARPHLLGSESTSQSTWLWGWENINEFPETVVGLSHDVRKFGAAQDISELTTAELHLDEELALRLTMAAKEVTGRWTHYPASAGAGTTVWLLVDADPLVLPAPRVKVSVRALMQGLTQTTVSDHRVAIDSYVSKRGIPAEELPEGGLRLLFADGSADLSFDDERRISNCDMNTPLEGEAEQQWAAATTGTPAEADLGSAVPRAEAPAVVPSAPMTEPDREASLPAEAADTGADRDESPADHVEDAPTPELVDDEAVVTDVPPSQSAADTAGSASEPAADGVSTKADSDPVAHDEEETTAQKPKKKGLFSKLFGR